MDLETSESGAGIVGSERESRTVVDWVYRNKNQSSLDLGTSPRHRAQQVAGVSGTVQVHRRDSPLSEERDLEGPSRQLLSGTPGGTLAQTALVQTA